MPGTNAKMTSVLPCLSDVRSTYFKKVSCSDRSQYVDIIVITTTLIITALGLRYLNEDEKKKHIDTSDTMCQTLGVDHENSTERKRKTDGNSIIGYSNEDEEKKQIDTSDAMCQTLGVDHENSTERQRKTDDNSIVVDDYFIINCKHSILQFYEGVKLQKGFEKKTRILDMCFVKINNGIHLVYIDADNMMMVDRVLSNTSNLRKRKLDHVPNRLSKIDDSTVAVIYKKELHVLIFDVVNMKHKTSYSITQSDIKKLQMYMHWNLADTHHIKSESRIEGIVALSPTKFILSDKSRLYSCNLDENNETINISEFACSLDPFDTARRLTHVTVSQDSCQEVIFIADENDKQLTSISQNENYISNHTKPNRGLQNVRAIGATEHRVYAATSAGISVFCHEEGVFTEFENQDNDMTDYKMMLEYEKHVEHTRGLCLHLDEQYIYIGLSCVIKQNDVILIFKFKPDGIFK